MSSTPRQLTHAAICCLPTLLPDAAAASDAPACDAKSSATAQQAFSCNGAVAQLMGCSSGRSGDELAMLAQQHQRCSGRSV